VQFSWLELFPALDLALLAQAKQGDANGGGLLQSLISMPILPFILIGIVFYLMLMRPEQKKRKQQEQLLATLKKNDRVITIGGIAGTVVNAAPGSTFVTLRVDDTNNTRLRVLRSAISRVGEPDVAEDESADSK
jgi:preprotein translocase subunit YajC